MKRNLFLKIAAIGFTLLFTFSATSCAAPASNHSTEYDILVDFDDGGYSTEFFTANGYGNGGMFDCTWRNSCAVVDNGVLSLTARKAGGGYEGAEFRSKPYYSYGYYAVRMKAADCPGVVSSFFLYTNRPVWDEIDIEFLGKDVTKVQFNYYTNGEGGHEYLYDLKFDASKEFHEYGFYWCEKYIEWYVDGKSVYKATKDIPTHPAQLMANVWNGKGDSFVTWAGKLDESKLPATAEYDFMGYRPAPNA